MEVRESMTEWLNGKYLLLGVCRPNLTYLIVVTHVGSVRDYKNVTEYSGLRLSFPPLTEKKVILVEDFRDTWSEVPPPGRTF